MPPKGDRPRQQQPNQQPNQQPQQQQQQPSQQQRGAAGPRQQQQQQQSSSPQQQQHGGGARNSNQGPRGGGGGGGGGGFHAGSPRGGPGQQQPQQQQPQSPQHQQQQPTASAASPVSSPSGAVPATGSAFTPISTDAVLLVTQFSTLANEAFLRRLFEPYGIVRHVEMLGGGEEEVNQGGNQAGTSSVPGGSSAVAADLTAAGAAGGDSQSFINAANGPQGARGPSQRHQHQQQQLAAIRRQHRTAAGSGATHARVTLASSDDADCAIAALHLRYRSVTASAPDAPAAPLVVLYDKTSPTVSAYGRAVGRAIRDALVNGTEPAAVPFDAFDPTLTRGTVDMPVEQVPIPPVVPHAPFLLGGFVPPPIGPGAAAGLFNPMLMQVLDPTAIAAAAAAAALSANAQAGGGAGGHRGGHHQQQRGFGGGGGMHQQHFNPHHQQQQRGFNQGGGYRDFKPHHGGPGSLGLTPYGAAAASGGSQQQQLHQLHQQQQGMFMDPAAMGHLMQHPEMGLAAAAAAMLQQQQQLAGGGGLGGDALNYGAFSGGAGMGDFTPMW